MKTLACVAEDSKSIVKLSFALARPYALFKSYRHPKGNYVHFKNKSCQYLPPKYYPARTKPDEYEM